MNISGLFQGLAVLAWLAAVGVIVVAAVRSSRGSPMKGGTRAVLVILVVAVVLTASGMGIVFINPEERGVIISAINPDGYRTEALGPGLHWIVPFAEYVVRYPISNQTYTMSIAPVEGAIQGDDSIAARTADGQEVFIDASVIYSLDPARVVRVHILWQDRYSSDLVRPQARGVIRDAVSQYGVEELVSSKRMEMTEMMRSAMQTKLGENGIILIDFVLRNITFSPEYAASVEQKQIAEQQAQQAKLTVEQKKQEAEQARQVAQGVADAAVTAAKGAAEARKIQADAEAYALLTIANVINANPSMLQYQYITNLSPNIQVMLLPSDNPFIIPLPGTSGVNGVVLTPTPVP